MQRQCRLRIDLRFPSASGERRTLHRFAGEMALPFVPSAGRSLHLGGRDRHVTVDSCEYDLVDEVFLVTASASTDEEHGSAIAEALRGLGFTEEELPPEGRAFAIFRSG